jgi:MFS family permease
LKLPDDRQAGPSQFSAWGAVVIGFATLAVSFSVRGALSLAMPAWSKEFAWTHSAISAIAAAAMLVMAAVAPFAGAAVDRHGPRLPLIIGLAAIGLGVSMVILAGSYGPAWLLPIGFGAVAALGFGLIAQHVVAAAIAQRFDANRGVATGVGTAGSTAGQLVVMPVLAALMATGAWRPAFLLLAVACAILIPVVWFTLRAGRVPGPSRATADAAPPAPFWTVVRSPVFQAVFWSYAICGFTTSGVIETHLLPYASFCGFTPIPSASAYGLLSGLNLVGMIGAGWLSDRVHRPLLLALIYVVRAGAFVLLMNVGSSYPLLLLFAILFGLFDYSTVPVTASYIAARLGVRHLGMAMGLLSAGHAVGGALGAWGGGVLFDVSGGYQWLWAVSIGLALLAVALVATLGDGERRPRLGVRLLSATGPAARTSAAACDPAVLRNAVARSVAVLWAAPAPNLGGVGARPLFGGASRPIRRGTT